MIDASQIKKLTTDDDVISILSLLGADYSQENNNEIIFYSVCHHKNDAMEHKPKLYWYRQSKTFKCYSCGFHGDVFSLIQIVLDIQFKESVKWLMSRLGIAEDIVKKPLNIDNWQKDLKKYLVGYEEDKPVTIFDKDGLRLFNNVYPQTWLKEGMSKRALKKFGVCWYGRNEQICLPVYDKKGNLIGIHGRNTRQNLVDNGLKYIPIKTLNEDYRFSTGNALFGLYQNKETIRQTKSVIVVEAPKSVILADDILDNNNTVALFGWNMNKKQRDILLELGINKVYISLDKQYRDINDDEFKIYTNQVNKIVNLFLSYCDVYVIWDKKNILNYKDSPFDCGKKNFEKLLTTKINRDTISTHTKGGIEYG